MGVDSFVCSCRNYFVIWFRENVKSIFGFVWLRVVLVGYNVYIMKCYNICFFVILVCGFVLWSDFCLCGVSYVCRVCGLVRIISGFLIIIFLCWFVVFSIVL